MPRLEPLEQIGGHVPHIGRSRGDHAEALKLAQTSGRRARFTHSPGTAGERIDAISGGDLGNVAVNGTDGRVPLGPEGDQVPGARDLRLPGAEAHVVSAARRRLEDGVPDAPGFVLETLGCYAADHHALLDAAAAVGQPLTRSNCVEVLRVASAHRAMQLLDDVAALAEIAQLLLPVRSEPPFAGGHPLGDAQALKVPGNSGSRSKRCCASRSSRDRPRTALGIDLVVRRAAVEARGRAR